MPRWGRSLRRAVIWTGSLHWPGAPPGSRAKMPISRPEKKEGEGRVRIGVARDEAFCFYYQDNLDSLAGAGAELVFFSPVRDRLPEVDAIYLGGGYPELHAKALERSACTADLRDRVADGLPVYAECGGLLYLCERLLAGAEGYGTGWRGSSRLWQR